MERDLGPVNRGALYICIKETGACLPPYKVFSECVISEPSGALWYGMLVMENRQPSGIQIGTSIGTRSFFL